MNNQFDELTKGLAQSITRRAALKRFGVGLGAFALAALGLANKAEAAKGDNGNGLPGRYEPCKYIHHQWVCRPGLTCHTVDIFGSRVCL